MENVSELSNLLKQQGYDSPMTPNMRKTVYITLVLKFITI